MRYKGKVLMRDTEPLLLEPSTPAQIERYLLERGLLAPDAAPIQVSRAGAGNMNLTLRITPAAGRPFIVKQGRPWVEKYPQIPAPFERTIVEAAFYAAVQRDPSVAGLMPAVLHVDADNHVLVLEDVGGAGDFTSIYGGAAMPSEALAILFGWLERLAAMTVPVNRRDIFANRAMRALNHEHMFRFPLAADNGLDLDGITPGLAVAARELAGDRPYADAVAALGRRYLADGPTLVHGDYFPGSWLKGADGVCVIDPEFCFLGDAEFDCGVLAAHLLLAESSAGPLGLVTASIRARGLDMPLVSGYAGVEIMRRLIGVAQLPLICGLDRKRSLLDQSRRLVLEPGLDLA
jgi:5-methylthioribose kinase